MKTILLFVLILFSITSYSQSDKMIGTYSYHVDDDTTGVIYITENKVEINTSIVYYDIDLSKTKFKSRKYNLDIKFQNEEGENIYIKLTRKDSYLILSINNNIVAIFDKYEITNE